MIIMSNVSNSMQAIVFADDTNLFCAGKDPKDVLFMTVSSELTW